MEKLNPIQGKVPGIKLPPKRKWVFRIIVILTPVVLIFLLAIYLKILHRGKNVDLFIESPGNKNYLVLNPDGPEKFFTNAVFSSKRSNELFKRLKEENTTRIFVLGSYSAIDYHDFFSDSSEWLQSRLINTFPNRQFEIINLSLTALNSNAVFGLARELVKYKPDAVLIYAGHDEYYGALGVGKMTDSSNVESSGREKSLMERMVESQPIAYQSKLYNEGVRQFTSNMEETLKLFERHQIPVYVSNLVSNERSLKPLNRKEAVDSTRYPGFNQEYQLGVEAFARNNFSQAYLHLQKAISIYSIHAMCSYYLGELTYLKGNYTEAKKYFDNARDFDELRFRAPEQFNDIIAKLCNKYRYAYLVDAKSAFDSAAENHIIGNDLMLDHIHPNLKGYNIMAEVFYNAVKEVQSIK